MFDRFTDRALKTMALALHEARTFNHDYIGTEHILLGLVTEGSGGATDVLTNLDVDSKRVRHEVEKLMVHGTARVSKGQLPFTPRSKLVLDMACEEATKHGRDSIGPEHLLLGLIREREGIAAQVLRNLKVEYDDVREEIVALLGDAKPRGVSVALVGLESEHCPTGLAQQVRQAVRDLGLEAAKLPDADLALAFISFCNPVTMYLLGYLAGSGNVRVVLLHLPDERIELPGSESLEINDELPARLEDLLR